MDAECGGNNPVCSPNNNCEQCLDNADCAGEPGAPLCDNNFECVECLLNTDCTDVAPFCSENGNCRECLQDNDCANNFQCQNGVCEPG